MSQIREAKVRAALHQQGLVRIDKYEPGAEQWCTGSLSFPDADPPYDSWGDCTECGELLIWVQKLEG